MTTPTTHTEVRRKARKLMIAFPEAFRDKYHPTVDELNDWYDEASNPNGKIFNVTCAFMNDIEFTISAQTNDDLKLCDAQTSQNVTGWDYSISANSRVKRNFDTYAVANLFRWLTWAPDRAMIVVDCVRYKGDETQPFAVDDWVRMYDVSTDVPSYTISNGEYASIAFAPLPNGSQWDTDLKIAGDGTTATFPSYVDDEDFISNENVDWFQGVRGTVSDMKAPHVDEINSMINVVNIAPFADLTFPHATASEQDGDPAINQNAQAQSRSTGNYEGNLQVWYPREPLTQTQNLQVAYSNLVRSKLTPIDSITRIGQVPEGNRPDVAPGEIVSGFHFKTTQATVPQPDGEAYRIVADCLTDGLAVIDTIAVGDTPVPISLSATSAMLDLAVPTSLKATLYGHNITWAADYEITQGAEFASVSNTGVVTALKGITGSASVIVKVTHPSGTQATISLTAAPAVVPTLQDGTATADVEETVILDGTDTKYIKALTYDGDVVDWFVPMDAETKLKAILPAKPAGTYQLVATPYEGTAITIDIVVS